MRIDAHQHFWRYNPGEHVWMTEAMGALKRDFLPEDLVPLLRQAGVDGTIAVQARQNLQETAWLLRLAHANPVIKGVVGWIDLRSPQVRDQLQTYARHPKFRGVRHLVHDEPDERFILAPDFLRGLGVLQDFKVTYDLLLFPKHLPYAIDVVERFPDQAFVLDHMAKPLIREKILSPWDSDIRQLATYKNVYCKVSGLVTEAPWGRWQPSDFEPYLDVVFNCFGPDRLMFGSDWPVCTLSAEYLATMRLVTKYVRRCSADALERILGQNAATFYKIPP